MKTLLISFLSLCIVGCASYSPAPNSCLPEALMMKQGLREKGIKAGILKIQYEDEGHAIVCYETDPNHGWAWDINWGSVKMYPWGWDTDTTGMQWSAKWMPKKKYISAEWLDEMSFKK